MVKFFFWLSPQPSRKSFSLSKHVETGMPFSGEEWCRLPGKRDGTGGFGGVLPLTGCITFGKFHKLSKPHFPHLQNRENNKIYVVDSL